MQKDRTPKPSYFLYVVLPCRNSNELYAHEKYLLLFIDLSYPVIGMVVADAMMSVWDVVTDAISLISQVKNISVCLAPV